MLPIREAMSRRFVLFSTVVSNRFLKTSKASWFVIFENWFSTRNPILYWFSKLSRMEFRVETANLHHGSNPSALPHNISNLRYWKLKFVHDSSTDEVEEKKGKWTEEEIQRLNEAVHVVTNTSEEEAVYHDIYWPAVSQMVKSRGTEQCRRKW